MSNLEMSKTLKTVLFSAACLSTISLAGVSHHVSADNPTNDPHAVTIVMKDGNHVVKKTTLAESNGVKLSKSAVAGQVPTGYKLTDHQSYKPSDQVLNLAVTSTDDTYIPVNMQFVDENGKVISTGIVKGTPGWKMDLSSSLPNGYTFADPSQSTYTIPQSTPSSPLIIKVKATGAVSDTAQNTTISNEVVKFVCNGQVVGQGTVSGDKGAEQDISNIIPNGYKLADGASKTVPVDGNSHEVQVVSVNGVIGGGTTATTDNVKSTTVATINDQLVNFVDNGKIVGTAHVSGTKGSTVDVSGSVPTGYTAKNASVTLTGDPATVQVSAAKKATPSQLAAVGGESNVGTVGGVSGGNVGAAQSSQHLSASSTTNGLIGGGTTATTDSVKAGEAPKADNSESGLSSTGSNSNLGIDGLTSEMASKTVSSDAANDNGLTSLEGGGSLQKLSNDGVIGGGTTATTDGVNANGNDKNTGNTATSMNTPSVNSDGGSESGVSNSNLGGGTTATTDGVSASEGSSSSSSASSSSESSSSSSSVESSSSMTSSSSSEQGSNQGGEPANNKNGFAQTGGTGAASHNSIYSLIYVKIPQWFHHLFK